jgi:hypothetical protein
VSPPVNLNTGKERYGGNPYLRIIRGQLEKYIADELGQDHLSRTKNIALIRASSIGIARHVKIIGKPESLIHLNRIEFPCD